MSNREYDVITECASSNFSETPHVVPSLEKIFGTSENDVLITSASPSSAVGFLQEPQHKGTWITMKVSVAIDLVELLLHSGMSRDSPLASIQVHFLMRMFLLLILFYLAMSIVIIAIIVMKVDVPDLSASFTPMVEYLLLIVRHELNRDLWGKVKKILSSLFFCAELLIVVSVFLFGIISHGPNFLVILVKQNVLMQQGTSMLSPQYI